MERLEEKLSQNAQIVSTNQNVPFSPPTLVTLDSLGLPKCRLIKVDVEGMEQEVLEGGAGTIRRHRPYLYVENDRKPKSEALIRYIDGLEYDMYLHKPALFNPANFMGNSDNIFGKIVSTNLLCTPRERPIVIRGFKRVDVPTVPGA